MDGWLIFSEPAGGAWNMSFDEAALNWAARERAFVIRFYEWSEPTLSLGYFQSVDERASHSASLECAWVRRPTGGGAILHDRELTYSIAAPIPDRTRRDVRWLYDAAHETLIQVLASFGIQAWLCESEGQQPGRSRPAGGTYQPFLCFQRQTVGDVLVDDSKIGGSAQRRGAGAVLQHGSVLLARSGFAPELPGLEELGGIAIHPRELAEPWSLAIASRLGIRLSNPTAIPDSLVAAAGTIQREKYGSQHWNARR